MVNIVRTLLLLVLPVADSVCTFLFNYYTTKVLYLETEHVYVSLRLRVQNAVSAQPCVGKFGISLVLLNFLDCNFRLWLETP